MSTLSGGPETRECCNSFRSEICMTTRLTCSLWSASLVALSFLKRDQRKRVLRWTFSEIDILRPFVFDASPLLPPFGSSACAQTVL